MHRHIAIALLAAFAGCGGAITPAATPTAGREPELARAPRGEGEVLVRGEASPASHGPYEFRGAYTVTFEQYAPEDPRLDFGAATSFAAALDLQAEIAGDDSVKLFEAATRTQTRRLRLDGRYFVDVSFGDYPYVIRFTPRG